MAFPKGVSGNPGGMPREVRALRKQMLGHAPDALETLLKLLACKNPLVRCRAAEAILDRAGLKPFAHEPDQVNITGTVTFEAMVLAADRLYRERIAPKIELPV